MRAALSVVLSDAVQDGLIAQNPCRYQGGRRQPGTLSKGERKERIRPMSAEERERFLTEVRGKHHGVLFELLVKTGLRSSEAFGLQVDDIDWRLRKLRVERAIELSTRAPKPTKTDEGRKVDLSPELLERLRAHVSELTERGFAKGQEPRWLFTSETGTVLDHNNVARTFRRRLKDAELPGFRL